VASELSRDDLRRLARLGAIRRLEELRREEAALRSAFPELFDRRRAPGPARGEAPARSRKRRRKGMSAAARRAASERMKKYWAERRKAKARGKG
jgi:hypothetical protein